MINRLYYLSELIRNLYHYKKWKQRIKIRDGNKCRLCGSTNNLSVHHIIGLEQLLRNLNITTVEQAKNCRQLWDFDYGITYCRRCHDKFHEKEHTNEHTQERNY